MSSSAAAAAEKPGVRNGRPVFVQERTAGAPATTTTVLMVFVAHVLVGMIAATQYVADRLGYHPNLGVPAYVAVPPTIPAWIPMGAALVAAAGGAAMLMMPGRRRSAPVLFVCALVLFAASRGPFYSPERIVVWSRAYREVPGIGPILDRSVPVGVAVMLLAGAATLGLSGGRKRKIVSAAHGTARWGVADRFLEAEEGRARRQIEVEIGLDPIPDRGFVVGRHENGDLLWYTGKSHLMTMAPTRRGKGVGAVIPNLLLYPGGVVCTDIKGENFAVTHAHRAERMGQQVFALDPFRITNGVDGEDHPYHGAFNPLDLIELTGPRADFARDDAQAIAEILVVDGGKESSHWTGEARALLMGFMLYVCQEYAGDPTRRTLITLRELIVAPGPEFQETLGRMLQSKHPLIRSTAAKIQQKDEKERSGVISTAQQNTAFLDSPQMARVLGESNIPLASIKEDHAMTIYLVMPPMYLETHAGWLRMMITCCNNLITRPGRPPRRRVLFLLDEFPNLGRMDPVLRGISLVGGYGVAFWLFIQDLAQLKGKYKDEWSTFFANCDVKQMFGTNDQATAEELSKMTGDATVFTMGGSEGEGRSLGKQSSSSRNYGDNVSEKARKLLNPDEVMSLPHDLQLLFVDGSPIVTPKLVYYQDKEFNEPERLWSENPMNFN